MEQKKETIKIINKWINKFNKERDECTIDDRTKCRNVKGFCIECEGRTFCVKALEEIKKEISGTITKTNSNI